MDNFKPIFIAKSLEGRILLGLAAITGIIIVTGWVAINENPRMQEFTERSEARSMEQGARIFEANCATCHGQDGRGLAGVAPALNTPHLFGYNFFSDIDNELALVRAQLGEASDAERINELTTREAILVAERQVLEEQLYYDYSGEVAELDEQIAVVNAEIESLEGIDNAARLDFFISQQEIELGLPDLEAEKVNITTPYEDAPEEETAPEGDAAAEGEAAPEGEAAAEGEAEADMAEEPADANAEEATAEGDTEAASEEAAPAEEATAQEELSEEEQAIQDYLAEYPGMTEAEAARLVEIDAEIDSIDAQLEPYVALKTLREPLVAQRGRFQAVNDAHAEVQRLRGEIAALEAEIAALGEAPEEGEDPNAEAREALELQISDLNTELDAAELARSDARTALIDNGDIVDWDLFDYDPASDDPTDFDRRAQVNWSGSLFDFVEGTLSGGRPTSASYWPNAMVAWAQLSGGPLRSDQIKNLTDFILNWERDFTIQDLRAVNQFAVQPVAPGAGGGAEEGELIESDNVTAIVEGIASRIESGAVMVGDVERGQSAFTSYGCAGCHQNLPASGPTLTGMYTRIVDNEGGRLDGDNGDPTQYIIHSIAVPNAYLVEGYNANLMPQNFTTDQMSWQDLVDIVAYIETQDQ